jgi:hypothetical protein
MTYRNRRRHSYGTYSSNNSSSSSSSSGGWGVGGLVALFAGVCGYIATGAFVPAVLIGVTAGICGKAGAWLGGIAGAAGGGILGSVGGGEGAAVGAVVGGIGGLLTGMFMGAVAGYNFSLDAVERYMMPPAPAVQEQPAAQAVDSQASLTVPTIAAPSLRA